MLFKRVWLSMSSVYREGTDCLALLLLSSRLWSQLANVSKFIPWLPMLERRSASLCSSILDDPSAPAPVPVREMLLVFRPALESRAKETVEVELERGLAAGGEHALVLDDPDLAPGARLELELALEAGTERRRPPSPGGVVAALGGL